MAERGPMLALLAALLTDENAERAAAECALRERWASPGFAESLAALAADASAPPRARLLAVICLRRRLDELRRAQAAAAASSASGAAALAAGGDSRERDALLARLLELLLGGAELSEQIEEQAAAAVAEAARADWVGCGPQVLQRVAPRALQRGPQQRRALQTLHRLLKEADSLRLDAAVRERARVCGSLLADAAAMVHALLAQVMQQAEAALRAGHEAANLRGVRAPPEARFFSSPPAAAAFAAALECCVAAAKCLHRLFVFSLPLAEDASRHAAELSVLGAACAKLNELRSRAPADFAPRARIDKLVCVLARVALESQRVPPVFAPSLREWARYAQGVLVRQSFDGTSGAALFERHTVQALRLLSTLLHPSSELFEEYEAAFAEALPPPALCELAGVLVAHYLPLKGEELDAWQRDPEDFYWHDKALHAEERLRPAAMRLLWCLLHRFPALLAPLEAQMLAVAARGAQGGILPCDAAILAIGIAAREPAVLGAALTALPGESALRPPPGMAPAAGSGAAFEALWSQVLAREAAEGTNKVLLRRAAWAVGEFAPDVVRSPTLLASCLRALLRLVAVEDVVVRLAAVDALRELVQAGGRRCAEAVAEVAGGVCEETLRLAVALHDPELGALPLMLLREVAAVLGPRLATAAAPALQRALPLAWRSLAALRDGRAAHIMSSLCAALAAALGALGPEGATLHETLAALVAAAAAPVAESRRGADAALFRRPALELLLALLRTAPAVTPPLRPLLPLVGRLAEESGGTGGTGGGGEGDVDALLLAALEALLALGGAELVAANPPVLAALRALASPLLPPHSRLVLAVADEEERAALMRRVKSVADAAETLLLVAPHTASDAVFVAPLLGFAAAQLVAAPAAETDAAASSASRSARLQHELVLTWCAGILARAACANPAAALSAAVERAGVSAPSLVDAWLRVLPRLRDPRDKRLHAAALARLVAVRVASPEHGQQVARVLAAVVALLRALEGVAERPPPAPAQGAALRPLMLERRAALARLDAEALSLDALQRALGRAVRECAQLSGAPSVPVLLERLGAAEAAAYLHVLAPAVVAAT